MTLALDQVFCRASLATAVLSRTRMSARSQAVSAIRELERRLVEAVGGEKIRGMPDIGSRRSPLYAVRVGSQRKHKSEAPLMPGHNGVLVVTNEGRLQVAQLGLDLVARTLLVEDEQLLAEDLSDFARVVQEVLEKHIALTEDRTKRLVKAEELARKIVSAIGVESR